MRSHNGKFTRVEVFRDADVVIVKMHYKDQYDAMMAFDFMDHGLRTDQLVLDLSINPALPDNDRNTP